MPTDVLTLACPLASTPLLAVLDGFGFWKMVAVLVILTLIWKRVRPTPLGYMEAVRLQPHDLPADVRAFFDARDEPLSRLGFYPAGDYQTVHGRTPNYARFYACALEDLFIEVDVYRKLGGGWLGTKDFRGVTCVTVFEDGASLHTGDFALPDGGASAPPQLIYRGRPGLSLEELVAAHREDAGQCALEHGPVLEYPPDQLASVSVYYAQYQREYFVKKGTIPPPDGYEQTKALVEVNADSTAEIGAP